MTSERMRCRICEGPTRHVFDLRSRRHGIAVPTFRCAACDAYFNAGGPVDYESVDLTGYYESHAAAIRGRYDRLFGCIATLARPGRFLDIGAGMGYSLEAAAARGWQAHGVEPNAPLARHAQGRGLAVENRYFEGPAGATFDLILVDNVLEHVPEPLPFLRQAGQALAAGGWLVVAIPPLDWARRLLGTLPVVRDRVAHPQLNVFSEVDEHLNMMGRRAMGRLAARAGLRREPLRFHHSPAFDNGLFRAAGLDDGYHFLRPAPP